MPLEWGGEKGRRGEEVGDSPSPSSDFFFKIYIYIYIYSRGGGREDLRGVGRGTTHPQNLLF